MPISGLICIEINNSEIRFFIEEVIYVLKRMLGLVISALRPSKIGTLRLFSNRYADWSVGLYDQTSRYQIQISFMIILTELTRE